MFSLQFTVWSKNVRGGRGRFQTLGKCFQSRLVFFLPSSCDGVDQLSYDSKSTDKQKVRRDELKRFFYAIVASEVDFLEQAKALWLQNPSNADKLNLIVMKFTDVHVTPSVMRFLCSSKLKLDRTALQYKDWKPW